GEARPRAVRGRGRQRPAVSEALDGLRAERDPLVDRRRPEEGGAEQGPPAARLGLEVAGPARVLDRAASRRRRAAGVAAEPLDDGADERVRAREPALVAVALEARDERVGLPR